MDQDEIQEIMALLRAQGRQPQACTKEVPVMTATTVCGQPVPIGDEGIERMMDLPLRDDIRAIVVRIHGDSMIEAGYADGDEVVVQLQPTAEDGDVVLAVRNGESTVKAFMRDSRHRVWLIPQNKTLPAIPVAEGDDFFIVGVVQGIYRRQPRLVQSKMIDYLTKALDSTGRAGRPQSKTFADIVARSFRDERLSHLHSIMEGRRGKEAAFVMQTAHKICWLTERPTFESIEKEFGPVGAKSNFYRYLQLRMTPDEQKAYFELFREEHNRLRDARLAQLAAEADDEEV